MGTSGSDGTLVAVVTASARTFPDLMCAIEEEMLSNSTCSCPASRSVRAGALPRYGTSSNVDARHQFEQLAAEMRRGSDPRRAHGDLARIGFCIGDQLRNAVDRNRGMHVDHVGRAHDPRDRREVSQPNSGCMLSGARRVHPVIVGWSTANRPLIAQAHQMMIPLPHGFGQLPGETGSYWT